MSNSTFYGILTVERRDVSEENFKIMSKRNRSCLNSISNWWRVPRNPCIRSLLAHLESFGFWIGHQRSCRHAGGYHPPFLMMRNAGSSWLHFGVACSEGGTHTMEPIIDRSINWLVELLIGKPPAPLPQTPDIDPKEGCHGTGDKDAKLSAHDTGVVPELTSSERKPVNSLMSTTKKS